MTPNDKDEKSPTDLENENNNSNTTPKILVNDVIININNNSINNNNSIDKSSNNSGNKIKSKDFNTIDSDSDSDLEIHCKSSVLFVSPKLTPVNSKYINDEIENQNELQMDDINDNDSDFESSEYEDEEQPCIVDYSEQMVSVAYPVFLTMFIVTATLRSISFAENKPSQSYIGTPKVGVIESGRSYDTDPNIQQVVVNTMINSFIFLAVLVLSTIIMVVLYKFRFMKALYGWLMATSILLLGVFGGFLFILVLTYINLPMDYITFIFIIWNFSAGGIVCIFWFSPLLLNQAYLICLSAFLALFLARFPSWTTWAILALVSIYDIFAVLCPGGPLQQLIDTAKKRGESIPALIYNASVVLAMAELTEQSTPSSNNNSLNNSLKSSPMPTPTSIPINLPTSEMIEPKSSPNSESMNTGVSSELSSSKDSIALDKGKGIKLGLGDFVFYSVLVGRAAYLNISVVFICFVAILTGLFLTLMLLAIFKRALPALPISIALGTIFYFISDIFLTPFINYLSLQQIFI